MEKLKQVDSQFLKCLSFTKEDTIFFKEIAKKKGYTMPRLYHDAVLKGVALIADSTAKGTSCQNGK